MATPYKLISFAADSADMAKKIADTMAKIPAAQSGPIVLGTKVYEREVKPVDKSVKPFTKHICQVLGTASAIQHALTLSTFTGVEVVTQEAPDDSFRTSVVMTDASQNYLTFSEEAEPAK